MSTYSNAAAIRAFRIMDILASAREPLSMMDITRQIELPKQTVHRLLKQLESASLITRTAPGRTYECSALVRKMALNLLMKAGPAAARRAILQDLADKVDETCNLTICSGESIVYLDRVEMNWSSRFELNAGSRVPMHCTSSGKLFLSFLPKQQRERILRLLPLRGSTDQTITDLDRLRTELTDIRKNRFSLNRGEFMPHMLAIAVPVMLDRSRVCAAIAIQLTEARGPIDRLTDYLPQLREAARLTSDTFQ